MKDRNTATIRISPFDSSGGGIVTYTTVDGTLEFEFDRWCQIISVPTADEWEKKHRLSWAKEKRSDIIQDLASQLASKFGPDFEITNNSIIFFDASERQKTKSHALQSAAALQSPSLAAFMSGFDQLSEDEKSKTTVFVIEVTFADLGKGECIICEVLHGNMDLSGKKLNIGFDQDVPLLAGRRYVTRELELVIKQYVNTQHVWRCRLHAEVDLKE